jgi:hypothetical protein
MPLSLLPPDLREVGAVFWMVFDPSSQEAVGFERLEGPAYPDAACANTA